MSGHLVLLRHGQSHANVERRLDTRPPGAALTPLGRDQARAFATFSRGPEQPAMLAHSVATRAAQTAAVIGAELNLPIHEVVGIHEVQVGELENHSDDAAVAEFNAVYERWQHGELDLRLPGGETGNEVLGRYVPVLTDLRMRYLDDDNWNGDIVIVSHGAAIRLASAVLAGVDADFAVDHHLDNAESVVLAPITDGRWSCVRWGALTPPFYPDPTEAGPGSVPDAVRSGTDPMG
ncbi:MAG: histidine phosphatase family protein [Mycobacterium sp.]